MHKSKPFAVTPHALRRLLVIGAAVTLLTAACGSEADPISTDTASNTTYTVQPGDEFLVSLESDLSSGYRWTLAEDLPGDVLRMTEDVYEPPVSNLAGAAGRQEFTFLATGDGTTVIQLAYVREFEDTAEPADRRQFEVVVGDGGAPVANDPGATDDPGAPDAEDAMDVGEVLRDRPTREIVLQGLLFDDGSGLVMCGALAESFPPQCPGESIAISNPDAVTAAFTESSGVRWTDRVALVTGVLIDDAFEIRQA